MIFSPLLIAATLLAIPVFGNDVKFELQGVGWTQFGRIEKSTDTVFNGGENNWNKNWQQSTGGLLVGTANINENWRGALGIGVLQTLLSRGGLDFNSNWYPFWVTFVSEANISYIKTLGTENRFFKATFGAFPYNYNPDIKNLGLYLLRGHVYPGAVVSGFETKHVLPAASLFGLLAQVQWGDFRNDFIINSENDEKPLYDF